LGYGSSNGSGGYSVTFVDDKVILTDPRTGQVRVLTREEWNALPTEQRQKILRDDLRYQGTVAPEDEKGVVLSSIGGFIIVANTNIVVDDNFDLYIGGQFIYSIDFSTDAINSHFASFGRVDEDVAKAALSYLIPEDSYVLNTVVPRPAGAYPGQTSTVFLDNTKNNQSGNFGYIYCGFTKGDRAYVDQVPYSPDDGEDYTTSVTWPQIQ
jgi:hypothetical protein